MPTCTFCWTPAQIMGLSSMYSNPCVKSPISKRPKIGFQDQLLLNAGQKNCRMLQGEHSEILWTFIKLPIVIKIFVSFIFESPFYTGFTVHIYHMKWLFFLVDDVKLCHEK